MCANERKSGCQDQQIADLKLMLEEKSKDLSFYQQENLKLKEKIHDVDGREHRESKDKLLMIMNDLNVSIAQCEQLRKEKNEISFQYNRCKEERSEALSNYTKIKEECQLERGEMSNRFEQRKRQIEDLSHKYEHL